MSEPQPTSPADPPLDGWYHTIDLGKGRITRGRFDHRSVVDQYGIPESLEGMTALDVATADGFFAFELERRGAERVLAVDLPDLAAADWLPSLRRELSEDVRSHANWSKRFWVAKQVLGSQVEYRELSAYDLSPERVGTFDFVFCGSLLLHLHNPLAALSAIRSVTDGLAVVETSLDAEAEAAMPHAPVMRFGLLDIERAVGVPPGHYNSYWRFTTRALEDMLLYAGFASTEPQGTFNLPPEGLPVTAVAARV